jgi:YD repeat-containing protein
VTRALDKAGRLERSRTGLNTLLNSPTTHDSNNRLTKVGSGMSIEYDSADNPTKIPGSINTYDNASELKTGSGLTYTYDELGERTKRTPTTGPATTYGYDEAGNLTSVERPKEGETTEIKNTYAYDGNGLRASQTISGTTSYRYGTSPGACHEWAEEIHYPGARATPGDVASPSNWKANPVPRIHLPGAGRGGHVPIAILDVEP